MRKILLICITALLLTSCEHRGEDITKFKGEYRYYKGIAEFYDCKESVKYYVGDFGIYTELQKKYLAEGVAEDDDVYMQVTGYLKEEAILVEGVDPTIVFVPVELLSIDKNRGCQRALRQGH